ncbi:hypothetical protein GCM10010343_30200 [Streptomyces avidinii]|uniref:DUF3073 family protein n=1 Tax=Streptomyces avidinii TaxID=1895 RepID=A0ABS4KZK7_STRAV|nr:hypothetical protein [Streptomyces avidinii]GGZ02431.1 hypothetical protein GCM10010343_30200 [Streptomyces avidinii]
MAKPSPIGLQKALKGAGYPAKRRRPRLSGEHPDDVQKAVFGRGARRTCLDRWA